MSKCIRTVIDEKGNVSSDFGGFTGRECVEEEERLRRDFVRYGLVLRTEERQDKDCSSEAPVQISQRF